MSGPAHPGQDGEGEVAEALALAHRLAVLAETDPDSPLLVATRAALDVADARRAAHRARRLAGLQVHGDDGPTWTRWADQWIPHDELTRRRAAPVDQRRDDPAPGFDTCASTTAGTTTPAVVGVARPPRASATMSTPRATGG